MRGDRLTMLDGLRGIAALSVVLVHYYFLGALDAAGDRANSWLPARDLLDVFYVYGFRAVELFWVISGYIFTRIYCFGEASSTLAFVANRFARLYPLHFVTLLVVAALQFLAFRTYGHFLIKPDNDAYHFVLNLFMISAWGLERGPSFNDVIWSVSVEIAIYGLFWVLRDWLRQRRAVGALIVSALCGAVVLFSPPTFIFACGFFYFFGSAMAFASVGMAQRRQADAPLIAGLALIGLALLAGRSPVLMDSYGLSCTYAALVLLAVRAEAWAGERIRAGAEWLGECSYGIYLWHMPLQLTILLAVSPFMPVTALAMHGWFMVAYLVTLLVVSRISYLKIEQPARARLRHLAGPRGGKPPAAEAASAKGGDILARIP